MSLESTSAGQPGAPSCSNGHHVPPEVAGILEQIGSDLLTVLNGLDMAADAELSDSQRRTLIELLAAQVGALGLLCDRATSIFGGRPTLATWLPEPDAALSLPEVRQ